MLSDRVGRRPVYLWARSRDRGQPRLLPAAGHRVHVLIVLAMVVTVNVFHDAMYGRRAPGSPSCSDRGALSGASIGYQFGSVLSGGTAPLIAAALLLAAVGGPGYLGVLPGALRADHRGRGARPETFRTPISEPGDARGRSPSEPDPAERLRHGLRRTPVGRAVAPPGRPGHRYRTGLLDGAGPAAGAGGFDALFLADVLGVYDVYGGPGMPRCARRPRCR